MNASVNHLIGDSQQLFLAGEITVDKDIFETKKRLPGKVGNLQRNDQL